jgi:hypothetical protein
MTGQTVSETSPDKLANIEGTGSTPEDFTNTNRKAAEKKVYQYKEWEDQYGVAPCSRYNSVKLNLTDDNFKDEVGRKTTKGPKTIF